MISKIPIILVGLWLAGEGAYMVVTDRMINGAKVPQTLGALMIGFAYLIVDREFKRARR